MAVKYILFYIRVSNSWLGYLVKEMCIFCSVYLILLHLALAFVLPFKPMYSLLPTCVHILLH